MTWPGAIATMSWPGAAGMMIWPGAAATTTAGAVPPLLGRRRWCRCSGCRRRCGVSFWATLVVSSAGFA